MSKLDKYLFNMIDRDSLKELKDEVIHKDDLRKLVEEIVRNTPVYFSHSYTLPHEVSAYWEKRIKQLLDG